MVKNCNLPFGYIIITGISKPCLCVIWLERKSNRPVGSLTLRVLRGGNSAGFLILSIREPFFSVKFFRFILWHM